MHTRGWNRFELAGLTGRNLLRIMQGVERVAADLKAHGTPPALDIYEKRSDLPRHPPEL